MAKKQTVCMICKQDIPVSCSYRGVCSESCFNERNKLRYRKHYENKKNNNLNYLEELSKLRALKSTKKRERDPKMMREYRKKWYLKNREKILASRQQARDRRTIEQREIENAKKRIQSRSVRGKKEFLKLLNIAEKGNSHEQPNKH